MAILALLELDCIKMINIFAKIMAICNKVIYNIEKSPKVNIT